MRVEMSDAPTVYYKGMLENGLTRYKRPGWHLPKGSRPGKWMPKQTPVLCESGYHVSTIDHLRGWIAPAIYVVEVRGAHVEDSSKSAWEEARLVRRIEGWGMAEMVEWAQKCAEHVVHLKGYSHASRAAYDAAYAAYAASYAYAAYDAASYAYASSSAAASRAAYDAAYAAYDAASYAYASSSAAASRAASYAYAAYDAEIQWQTDLLKSMLGVD